MGTLAGVTVWYPDLCCLRCTQAQLSQHVLVDLFDNVTRRPLLHPFHACKRTGDTLHVANQEYATAFKRDLAAALFEAQMPDVDAVAQHVALQARSDVATAKASVLSNLCKYRRNGAVRMPTEAAAQLDALELKWTIFTEEQPTLSPVRPSKGKGSGRVLDTFESLASLRSCVSRGCLHDPFPPPAVMAMDGLAYAFNEL